MTAASTVCCMAFFRTRAGWQASIILFCGTAVLVFAHGTDAHERILIFLHRYEAFELDELLLALDVVGLMSIVYACLRLLDLRQEKRRRDHAEARADWMARHDALTGLYNRHALSERLEILRQKRNQRFGIILLDLDGFKKINDAFGHAAGDCVLQEVASRITSLTAAGDTFRFGGDEFVVIIPEPSKLVETAQQIVSALCVPIAFNGIVLDIGASAGFAEHPKNAPTPAECLTNADAAMYAAKASGRGRVYAYDQSMQERQFAKARLEHSLREALRAGEIKPYYQPILDLQTGAVMAFEALARWEQAPGKFVPPSEFISIAEDMGLIVELTDQLLRMACRDALHWPEHVILSFNISPTQLQERGLGLRILNILMEAGLTPNRLEIEITETALVHELETAALILNDLHEGGIRIALDDFGTGYSSLAQLSNFQFDKIKIDRSFVSSFQDQEKQEKIVKAIVGLGIGLDVPTTAEGIETPEQLRSLIEMGCRFGQGYLFGKAVPAHEIPEAVLQIRSAVV
ncbi:putative bifunctional diguanylate cyclase/phosphodiesterase [Rhizobium terrae]|uniref:putative bifunctional diguanylate cyclase/phosphodiesterase n=1 Tax=Rhizobium terrae TaxID=2171756 RepID=UPI000E3D8191|nr:EAL domain-containing protein [Rhizobium terrae]